MDHKTVKDVENTTETRKAQSKRDFDVLEWDEEFNQMVEAMIKCGMKYR
jgi:hypothetical protein